MTESEAINRLIDHFRIHDDGRPTPYLDDAVSIAFKALEKQIPKKIIHFQYDDGRINYGCPICKRKIISKIDDKWCAGEFQNFCDRCGQKLSWESDTD